MMLQHVQSLEIGKITCDRKLETTESIFFYLAIYGAPVILVALLFLLLITIYVVPTYFSSGSFAETTCRVETIEQIDVVASCNAGTNSFSPCLKVYVSFATANSNRHDIIMENEQALLNCQECSYTFGHHSWLYSSEMECDSWKENFDYQLCINQYKARFANSSQSYRCYYNSLNHSQVIHAISLNSSMIIHGYLWPLLLCVAYVYICISLFRMHKQVSALKKAKLKRTGQKGSVEVQREWKKKQLDKCLGTRFSSRKQSRQGFQGSVTSLETLSASQRKETFRASEQHDDMRHLDLAVTEQNLDDLVNVYAQYSTDQVSTFPRNDARKREKHSFDWYSTLPASSKHCKNHLSYNRRHHSVDYWNYGFDRDYRDHCTETVSITTSNMLTEHEIDHLFKKHTSTKNPVLMRKKSETTV